MTTSAHTGLPLVSESEATGKVAEIYQAAKREMQLPEVPNMLKAMAVAPAMMSLFWTMQGSFYESISLPQTLVSMILYTIAANRSCEYCSAAHEVTCRSLGVDEETLAAVVKDLGSVNPVRVRSIIEFALKAANFPKDLVLEDYDLLRNEGVADEEIAEIIMIAGVANLFDTLADAFKMEVDPFVKQTLQR